MDARSPLLNNSAETVGLLPPENTAYATIEFIDSEVKKLSIDSSEPHFRRLYKAIGDFNYAVQYKPLQEVVAVLTLLMRTLIIVVNFLLAIQFTGGKANQVVGLMAIQAIVWQILRFIQHRLRKHKKVWPSYLLSGMQDIAAISAVAKLYFIWDDQLRPEVDPSFFNDWQNCAGAATMVALASAYIEGTVLNWTDGIQTKILACLKGRNQSTLTGGDHSMDGDGVLATSPSAIEQRKKILAPSTMHQIFEAADSRVLFLFLLIFLFAFMNYPPFKHWLDSAFGKADNHPLNNTNQVMFLWGISAAGTVFISIILYFADMLFRRRVPYSG